jgi:hypothetical protein
MVAKNLPFRARGVHYLSLMHENLISTIFIEKESNDDYVHVLNHCADLQQFTRPPRATQFNANCLGGGVEVKQIRMIQTYQK